MRLELHLVDLLLTYYENKFATNSVRNRTDGPCLSMSSADQLRLQKAKYKVPAVETRVSNFRHRLSSTVLYKNRVISKIRVLLTESSIENFNAEK